MSKTQPQKIKDWKKRLAIKYTDEARNLDGDFDELISDIEKLLKSEKAALLERIRLRRRIRPLERFADKRLGEEYELYKRGYNQAIADLEKLKEEIKKEL